GSVVKTNGSAPGPGNVSSTKKAVQPSAGGSTRPTNVPSGPAVSGRDVQAGPIVSRRKSRAFGLVACHSRTFAGAVSVVTVMLPSAPIVQENDGRGAPLTIAS